MLTPDYYYRSVRDIDLERLKEHGITTLLFDLDNTLLARNVHELPDDLRVWARAIKDAGFRVFIVSNNWHRYVIDLAADLGLEIVAKAIKPFPFAFRRALRLAGASPATAAVIGDQIFTDIVGGRLMGMTTILVTPLSESDLPHTRLLRRIEKLVLADRRPLP